MAEGDYSSRTELCGPSERERHSPAQDRRSLHDHSAFRHRRTSSRLARLRNTRSSGSESPPFLQTDEDVDIKTGFEFWLTPPRASKPAKPYKQFLITLSAILPLTSQSRGS